MRKTYGFVLILMLGFLGSCSKGPSTSGLYTPTSADVTANATLAELKEGRTLYVNNCGACHSLFSPDDYSVSRWKTIIPNMAPNTGMSAAQVALVTKYVCRGKQ